MNQTDIQATLFEILQAVIALCEAEKIAYFLIGGGCLGIARHDHGFVPWDDDLDIAVWAGDMPRFLAAARQLPAPLLAVKKPQEINPTIKIMDNRTRIHGAHDAPAPPDQPNGVFIDVVPMMHWRSARWKRLDDMYTRLLAVSRTPHSPVRWKRVIKGAAFCSGAGRLLRWLGRAVYHPWMQRMDAHCRATGQGIVSGALGRHWTSRCDYEVIFPLRQTHLMHQPVAVPNDLHAYLKNRYGEDYMQMPDPGTLWTHFDRAERVSPS